MFKFIFPVENWDGSNSTSGADSIVGADSTSGADSALIGSINKEPDPESV